MTSAQVAVAKAAKERRVGEQIDDAVLRLALRAGLFGHKISSITFQVPPEPAGVFHPTFHPSLTGLDEGGVTVDAICQYTSSITFDCTAMPQTTQNIRKKPSLQAVRRAVASSTAVETGQSVQQLEQKLQNQSKLRFQHIKLAA